MFVISGRENKERSHHNVSSLKSVSAERKKKLELQKNCNISLDTCFKVTVQDKRAEQNYKVIVQIAVTITLAWSTAHRCRYIPKSWGTNFISGIWCSTLKQTMATHLKQLSTARCVAGLNNQTDKAKK